MEVEDGPHTTSNLSQGRWGAALGAGPNLSTFKLGYSDLAHHVKYVQNQTLVLPGWGSKLPPQLGALFNWGRESPSLLVFPKS